MTTLTSLPAELLYHITHDLVDRDAGSLVVRPGFAAWARCSRQLHCIANTTLYSLNRDHAASSAVEWAAKHGRLETLEVAASFGLDLSTRFGEPLRQAICAGQAAAVDWLLDHGAPVDGVYNPQLGHRYPPLFVALDHGQQDIALRLLSRNAIPFFKTGEPPADLGLGTHFDTTALHHAASRGMVQIAEHLVTKLAMPVDIKDKRAFTPFESALMFSNPDTVRALISLGADAYSSGDIPPVSRALMVGKHENALALLEATMSGTGAAPIKPIEGFPVLLCVKTILASTRDPATEKLALLQRLIQAGADVNATYPGQPTALGEAILRGCGQEHTALPAIKLLVDAGAADAASSDWCAQLRSLTNLARSTDQRIRDQRAAAALLIARALLSYGARPDLRHPSPRAEKGESFLEVVAQLDLPGFPDLVESLDLGDIPQAHLGETLRLAIESRNMPICRILVSRGVAWNPADHSQVVKWANERIGQRPDWDDVRTKLPSPREHIGSALDLDPSLADEDDETFRFLLGKVQAGFHYDILFHCLLVGDRVRTRIMLDRGYHLVDRTKLPTLMYLAEQRQDKQLHRFLADAQVKSAVGAEETKMPLAPVVQVSELAPEDEVYVSREGLPSGGVYEYR